MKKILLFFLCLISGIVQSQTINENLNTQLKEMKNFHLAEDYNNLSNYTYPEVIKMMGGKSNMVQVMKNAMSNMKKDGFYFLDVNYKDPSSFIKESNELQCSLTQQILMKTPRGKIKAEYTLIAISADNGKNWTFIDTSGKSKETMLMFFPNLNPEIIIKPKRQEIVD